jgi:2-oxoglutarate dehydrogenase complex dehydrogenase (E1) component-like enzyme
MYFASIFCRQNTGALAELRHLVDKYRHVGHLNANWDPLKLWERR